MTILFFIVLLVSLGWFLRSWYRYSEYDDAYKEKKMFKISGFVTLGLWLLFFWLFRPWFHSLVVLLFYIGLPMTILFSLSLFFLIYCGLKHNTFSFWPEGALTILCVGFLVLAGFSHCFYKKALYNHTTYQKVTSLPKVTKIRILPLAVAKRFADDSFQESREKLDSFAIVNHDGKLVWQAPRVPDGSYIYFTNKMGGVVELSAETKEKEYLIENFKMEASEGVGIHDNIRFLLYKKRYFINIPDSIYYLLDKEKGKRVAVVPFVKYKFAFPVRYPVFGGVFLVYEDKEVVELTPEKAEKSELLKGNVFYPEWLNRKEVEAYAYHRGIPNRLFTHEDQIEIADVLEGGNPQPYLMMTATGPTWFTATEPYGKAYGIFKIFTRDANSSKGPVQILELPKDSALTGPKRVVGYVRNQVEVPDWKSFGIIETKPAPRDSTLYWHLSIVPYTTKMTKDGGSKVDYEKSFTGVYATVFVNSKTNKVYSFKHDENAIKFVNGEWNMRVTTDFDTITPVKERGEEKQTDIGKVIDNIIQELLHLKEQLENR